MLKGKLAVSPWLSVALAAGIIAIGGGAAFAAAQDTPSPGTEPAISATARGETEWPVNASGQTYGSLAEAKAGDKPDLIQAWTTDGKSGYVKRDEFDAATGSNVKNPAEALAWMKTVAERKAAGITTTIPVYTQDGQTVIGSFTITPPEAITGEAPPSG